MAYKKYGEVGLKPKSTRPKSNVKETPIRIKERIIELRKETKKCALKLKWQLEKEGIVIHKNTIQKIIKKEGLATILPSPAFFSPKKTIVFWIKN